SNPGRSATCRSLLQGGSYHLSTRLRATLGRHVVRTGGVRRRADPNARYESASPDRGRAAISRVRECADRVGGSRCAAYIWDFTTSLPDARARGELMLHELFHRIQLDLGLMTAGGQTAHLL